jgi:phosphoenolpyruvate carboxylase
LYYRSFDRGIEQIETQLTIQGQTIMSNFGHHDAARFHIEHLCTANLENLVFPPEGTDPPAPFVDLLGELSDCAFDAYRALRDDPLFLDFLRDKSPLSLFSLLTIGSRPVKRSQSTTLSLSDLRAIPFVASWSVLKLQIPGFYGLGTALEAQKRKGRLGELQALYHESRFFRTLLDNAAMSLLKSRTDVTSYMQRDPTFGAIWTKIRDELDRTVDMVLAVSGQSRLLEKDAHTRRSIALREQMMLPLTVIIGYVMVRLTKTEGAERAALEKMGTKALAAIINATRNAA